MCASDGDALLFAGLAETLPAMAAVKAAVLEHGAMDYGGVGQSCLGTDAFLDSRPR